MVIYFIFRRSHTCWVGSDYALSRRNTAAATIVAAGCTQTMQSTGNLWSYHIRHSAATESHCFDSCRRRKEKRMGTTLDYAWFSCHRKTTIYISWEILCWRWNFNGRLLFSTTSVQCSKVTILIILISPLCALPTVIKCFAFYWLLDFM